MGKGRGAGGALLVGWLVQRTTNEQTNERTNKRTNEQTNERTNEQTNSRRTLKRHADSLTHSPSMHTYPHHGFHVFPAQQQGKCLKYHNMIGVQYVMYSQSVHSFVIHHESVRQFRQKNRRPRRAAVPPNPPPPPPEIGNFEILEWELHFALARVCG